MLWVNSERYIVALMTFAQLTENTNGLNASSYINLAIQASIKTWAEPLSYCILILGIIGDYLSTHIGLTYENLFERNPITRYLILNKMWLPVNLIVVAFGIAIPYLILHSTKENNRGILSLPIIHGITRLSICLWNCSLII